MLRIAQDSPAPPSNHLPQRRFRILPPHLILSITPLPAPILPVPLLPVSLLPVHLPVPRPLVHLLPAPFPPSGLHPTLFFPHSPAPLQLLRHTAYPLLRGYPSHFFPASLLLPHPVMQQTRRFTPLPSPQKRSVQRKPRSSSFNLTASNLSFFLARPIQSCDSRAVSAVLFFPTLPINFAFPHHSRPIYSCDTHTISVLFLLTYYRLEEVLPLIA